MTWPSSVPITTRFSPTPGPPDRRSLAFFFSFFGSQVQTFLPVCRSMACTPPVIAAANTWPLATAGPWRTPMRRSPLPRLTDQALLTFRVGSNLTSSAGSCAFFAAASLPANQPFMVLQPVRAMPIRSTVATRVIMTF